MCTSGPVEAAAAAASAAVRNEARANFDFYYYLQKVLHHRDLPAKYCKQAFLDFLALDLHFLHISSIQFNSKTTSIQVGHSQNSFPFDLLSPPLSALFAYFVQSVSVAACPSCQVTITLVFHLCLVVSCLFLLLFYLLCRLTCRQRSCSLFSLRFLPFGCCAVLSFFFFCFSSRTYCDFMAIDLVLIKPNFIRVVQLSSNSVSVVIFIVFFARRQQKPLIPRHPVIVSINKHLMANLVLRASNLRLFSAAEKMSLPLNKEW